MSSTQIIFILVSVMSQSTDTIFIFNLIYFSFRSFQYVDDLVEGLIKLMNGNYSQPVNIGNPEEYTVKVLTNIFKKLKNKK